jgi:phosphomethylpyrimidine synthase
MPIKTQLMTARAGQISPAVRVVARRERTSPETVRAGIAAGRIVIPLNVHHRGVRPVGVGGPLSIKINANIGNSALSSCRAEERRKLEVALQYGSDFVMDLSTGDDADRIRQTILDHSPAPVGTVPIYQAVSQVREITDLTPELLLAVIEKQARQGVDFMTLHAGLLRQHLPAARRRLLGIVSRGGAILAAWMKHHRQENPLYTHFAEVLAICAAHDVTISLGDGLRPGCLADASDAAQFGELAVLGELVRRCRQAGVQVMVEGPGHIPLNQIQMNMEREAEVCAGAPFYVLGPVVTDCAPGYDHITAAIGAALGAFHGAALLCYVTPKEHLGLPEMEDVRQGVVAFKIAAHAADIARGVPGARDRDDAISKARVAFDWERQFKLALDPARARAFRQQALRRTHPGPDAAAAEKEGHFCTMCGPKFCAMRITQEGAARANVTRKVRKRRVQSTVSNQTTEGVHACGRN